MKGVTAIGRTRVTQALRPRVVGMLKRKGGGDALRSPPLT